MTILRVPRAIYKHNSITKLFIIQFYNFHFDKSTFRYKVQHHVVSHKHLQRNFQSCFIEHNCLQFELWFFSWIPFDICFIFKIIIRKKEIQKIARYSCLVKPRCSHKKIEVFFYHVCDLSIETDKKN